MLEVLSETFFFFFQAKGMGRENFKNQMLKALRDFVVISNKPKFKGLPCLLRARGTHCSSSCFISFPVKKGWEQHGSSQAVCASETSVIGIFGRVTETERLHWWEKSTGLHLQSTTPALGFYSPNFKQRTAVIKHQYMVNSIKKTEVENMPSP